MLKGLRVQGLSLRVPRVLVRVQLGVPYRRVLQGIFLGTNQPEIEAGLLRLRV